ncbi:MAG TPA: DUF6438 domain-containing protein [Kofleriaceae bacterium]
MKTHTTTADSFVRMERVECLGSCPVYRVTLYADGAVEFHGVKEVPVGTQWGTSEPAQVKRLMARVEQAPQWHCDPQRITTDQPATVLTVWRDGKEVRRVGHDLGDPCAPHDVMELIEADIDITAGTASFISHK